MTQVVSDALDIREFQAVTELEPLNTHFQKYTADTSSDAGTSWFINSPGRGALLYSEAYIEYTMSFANVAAATNVLSEMFIRDDNAGSLRSNNHLALRSDFPMTGAMQSITANINGTVINEQPDRWSHEVARFYATKNELNSICTMSGGEMDMGSFIAYTQDDFVPQVNAVGAGTVSSVRGFHQTGTITNFSAVGLLTQAPEIKQNYNKGFQSRFHRLSMFARDGTDGNAGSGSGAANAAGGSAPTQLSFKIFERVPVAPFMLWETRDERRSIPNIDKLELRIGWNSNARNMILQGLDRDALTLPATGSLNVANLNFDFSGQNLLVPGAAKPVLNLRWYIPPAAMVAQMPREISIPIKEMKYNSFSFPAFTHGVAVIKDGQAQQTFNNIRLEQIPSLMLIYIKPDPSQMGIEDPSEFHLEIESMDISIDGDSGKLLQATQAELFAMYVRNAGNRNSIMPDFDEWRKYYCTVAVRPQDLGVRQGPGINHPVTLSVTVKYNSWWNIPHKMQFQAVNQVGFRDTAGENRNLWSRNDAYIQGKAGLGANSIARAPIIHIASEYDLYELTLSMAGGSRRKLLALAPPSASGVPSLAPEQQVNLGALF